MKRRDYTGNNFGLAGKQPERRAAEEHDHWFWESKSKKKQKAAMKEAEIERMKAETEAMQQLMNDEGAAAGDSGGIGKIALLGGLGLLLFIGLAVYLKNRGKGAGAEVANAGGEKLEAADLIV